MEPAEPGPWVRGTRGSLGEPDEAGGTQSDCAKELVVNPVGSGVMGDAVRLTSWLCLLCKWKDPSAAGQSQEVRGPLGAVSGQCPRGGAARTELIGCRGQSGGRIRGDLGVERLVTHTPREEGAWRERA